MNLEYQRDFSQEDEVADWYKGQCSAPLALTGFNGVITINQLTISISLPSLFDLIL